MDKEITMQYCIEYLEILNRHWTLWLWTGLFGEILDNLSFYLWT